MNKNYLSEELAIRVAIDDIFTIEESKNLPKG